MKNIIFNRLKRQTLDSFLEQNNLNLIITEKYNDITHCTFFQVHIEGFIVNEFGDIPFGDGLTINYAIDNFINKINNKIWKFSRIPILFSAQNYKISDKGILVS